MQIVSYWDNLHEMSIYFPRKIRKTEDQWSYSQPETICSEQVYDNSGELKYFKTFIWHVKC